MTMTTTTVGKRRTVTSPTNGLQRITSNECFTHVDKRLRLLGSRSLISSSQTTKHTNLSLNRLQCVCNNSSYECACDLAQLLSTLRQHRTVLSYPPDNNYCSDTPTAINNYRNYCYISCSSVPHLPSTLQFHICTVVVGDFFVPIESRRVGQINHKSQLYLRAQTNTTQFNLHFTCTTAIYRVGKENNV